MLATAGPVPTGPEWALELKWDGMRALAYVEGPDPDDVVLVSRAGRRVSRSYPDVARALAAAAGTRRVVLDGEIVVLSAPSAGAPARPSFDRLQLRMGVQKPSPQLVDTAPTTFVAFDLLCCDDEALLDLPYLERRARLERLGLDGHRGLVVSPALEGLDAQTALEVAESHGMEGIVAKRRDAPYRPGRSHAWIKTPLWRATEAVIGGWAEGRGRHAGAVGAVLLGLPTPSGRLRYIGHVGTGLRDSERDQLSVQLTEAEIADNPFDGPVPEQRAARWTQPTLVAEARFRSWSDDGVLRHSSWRGCAPTASPTSWEPVLLPLIEETPLLEGTAGTTAGARAGGR
ncbi:non-homologous end-joining DNA ligase [Actinomycetospora sp. CA-101289]|uniref:non-homologous end-joining DNA ligase n=1 Tax=Actinomycetospora sp. CA-101289 TaxID=3239893 RepID=UPI003D977A47